MGQFLNNFPHILDHLPFLQVLILELFFEVTDFFQNSARILRCQHTLFFSAYEKHANKKGWHFIPAEKVWVNKQYKISPVQD